MRGLSRMVLIFPLALVVVAVIAPLFAFFGSAAIDRRRIAMLIAALAMGVLGGRYLDDDCRDDDRYRDYF